MNEERKVKEGKIVDIVKSIIAVVAPDADLSEIKNDKRIRDQTGMDSMDFLDIVMELRKRYKIEVLKEDYPKLATLDGCVKYLYNRMPVDF